jgi:RES domain
MLRRFSEILYRRLKQTPVATKSAILCSQCFSDNGLRIEAEKIGSPTNSACPHCARGDGKKLTEDNLQELVIEFFCNGSVHRADFGAACRLASNSHHCGEREVEFPFWLKDDVRLLEDKLHVGLFHYGPPLWQIGEVSPLTDLRRKSSRSSAIAHIVSCFPERVITSQSSFYRIRTNLLSGHETDPAQYDSPPKVFHKKFGRLDSASRPVLYGSEDLEICIHECRVTIPDECFIALIRPVGKLRMLDLTGVPNESGDTPCESIDIAVRFLFSAESHSYEITQAIARTVAKSGFDGIYYPSYFSTLKETRVPNIGIFGHPIADKKVEIECINRARLKAAKYEIRMGPIFS